MCLDGAGVSGGCIPKLHDIRLGQDALDGPSGQLAAVVLHLGGDDGTALRDELATPVESATAALGLAVELVEGLDGDELVLAADGVLLDGVDLGTDHQVDGLLIVSGEVEAAVLVGLAGGRVGVLGGVVEGVGVGHVDLGRLALGDDLVSEVVVDIGGLLGQGAGLVEGVLAAVGGIEGRVGGVLVDRHHVEVGIVALVEEDLVTLADNDNVPGVDGSRRAHEHGQNAVGGEDGGLVALGELLDDRIRRRGDVVRSAVDGHQLLLGALDGLLVVGAVVVVQEAVVLEVLALVRVEVQLGQAVEVNLLEQLPVGLDVDAGVAVASRLVVVLPAEAAATASTTSLTAAAVVALAPASAARPLERSPSATGVATSAALTATAGEDGTAAISRLGRVSRVADEREGRLVLGRGRVEGDGVAGSVDLLVWNRLAPASSLVQGQRSTVPL